MQGIDSDTDELEKIIMAKIATINIDEYEDDIIEMVNLALSRTDDLNNTLQVLQNPNQDQGIQELIKTIISRGELVIDDSYQVGEAFLAANRMFAILLKNFRKAKNDLQDARHSVRDLKQGKAFLSDEVENLVSQIKRLETENSTLESGIQREIAQKEKLKEENKNFYDSKMEDQKRLVTLIQEKQILKNAGDFFFAENNELRETIKVNKEKLTKKNELLILGDFALQFKKLLGKYIGKTISKSLRSYSFS